MINDLAKPSHRGVECKSEARDCTVRALANAANIAYDVSHAFLKAAGREDRKGINCRQSYEAYTKAGLTLKSVHGTTIRARALSRCANVQPKSKLTLSTLLLRLRQGRYVVMVTGHALAVVDGKVIDSGTSAAGKEVFAVYAVQ